MNTKEPQIDYLLISENLNNHIYVSKDKIKKKLEDIPILAYDCHICDKTLKGEPKREETTDEGDGSLAYLFFCNKCNSELGLFSDDYKRIQESLTRGAKLLNATRKATESMRIVTQEALDKRLR